MPLAPGTTIGRYRIESRIGSGAMGVVYLATDTRLERRVALKLIEPSLAADPDFRARFERETRAAAALDHPHVLPVCEAGEDDGRPSCTRSSVDCRSEGLKRRPRSTRSPAGSRQNRN